VTLEVPATSDALWLLLEPAATFPKLSVEGFTASCPAARPLPERATVAEALEASLLMVKVPVAFPEVAGVKATVRLRLWPALNVAGSAGGFVRLKPVPVTAIVVMSIAMVELELLLSTTELVLLDPSEMLPKFTEVTLKFRVGAGGLFGGFEDCGPVEVPAHPKNVEIAPKTMSPTTPRRWNAKILTA